MNLLRLAATALLAALLPLAAQADDSVEPSGYTPAAGQSFFLLAGQQLRQRRSGQGAPGGAGPRLPSP